MASYYLPRKDRDFCTWVTYFLRSLFPELERIGFPGDEYRKLAALRDDFAKKLEISSEPATHTKTAVQVKNDARRMLEKAIQQDVREFLQFNRAVTNGDRDNLGLPIYKTGRTPPPPPTDMPLGGVDTSTHQRHIIHVTTGTLTGKAKPPKVRGYEVWRKVGGNAPASDGEWTYVNFSSRTPLMVDYPQTEVGKTVYYRFRWVNTRNLPGPWSEGPVSAVIP
jgi:hypothetical protein